MQPECYCWYDNPRTMSREFWRSGVRIAGMSSALVHQLYLFSTPYGEATDFTPGRVFGDPTAISENEPGYGHGV